MCVGFFFCMDGAFLMAKVTYTLCNAVSLLVVSNFVTAALLVGSVFSLIGLVTNDFAF